MTDPPPRDPEHSILPQVEVLVHRYATDYDRPAAQRRRCIASTVGTAAATCAAAAILRRKRPWNT